MVLNPSNEINSLPTSYTTFVPQMTIHSFTESQQQHVSSIYDVQAAATRATPACCGSSRMFASRDSVMHQSHGQSAHDSSTTLQTDSLRSVKETYAVFIDPTHGQTRGQSTHVSIKTLQVHSRRTLQDTSAYSASIDRTHGQTHGQSIHNPLKTLQTDSFRAVKGTYSPFIVHTHGLTHGQSIYDPLKTPQTDSLRAVKGTYSTTLDHTNGHSTHDTPKTPPTDSLRTAKGTTAFSAPMNHGSLVVIDNSEMASSSQEQAGLSTIQVRPSLSSLSPTLSPSSSG